MQYDDIIRIVVIVLNCFVSEEAVRIFCSVKQKDYLIRIMAGLSFVVVGAGSFELNGAAVTIPIAIALGTDVLIFAHFVGKQLHMLKMLRSMVAMSVMVVGLYVAIAALLRLEYDSLIVYMLFVIVEYIVVRSYEAVKDGKYTPKSKLFMLLPTIVILIGVYIIASMELQMHQRMLVMVAVVIVIVFLLAMHRMIINQYEEITEARIEKERSAAHNMYMEMVLDSAKKVRSVRHDMNNHIIAMRQIIDSGEYGKLEDYIKKIGDDIEESYVHNSVNQLVETGNMELDALINYKINKMTEYGICVEHEISIPREINLTGYYSTIILGNILDNAMRAVSKLDKEKRIVRFKMNYSKNLIFINVSNPYEGKLQKGKDGLPMTTKSEKEFHGLGVANVKRAVEAHSGTMKINDADGWFSVDIKMIDSKVEKDRI